MDWHKYYAAVTQLFSCLISCLGLCQYLVRPEADQLRGQVPAALLRRRQLPVREDLGKHRGKVHVALAFLGQGLLATVNVSSFSKGNGFGTFQLLFSINGPNSSDQGDAVVKHLCLYSYRDTATTLW